MPVEIRELIIRTEISVGGKANPRKLREKDLYAFKRQILEECKIMINKEATKKNNSYKKY